VGLRGSSVKHRLKSHQTDYSKDTENFDLRDGRTYKKETKLEYKTKGSREDHITLHNDYSFNWEKINNLYFLKLPI
jgi:hypothetical protein